MPINKQQEVYSLLKKNYFHIFIIHLRHKQKTYNIYQILTEDDYNDTRIVEVFTLHISCSYTIWLFFTWHTWHEILTLLVTRCICFLPPSPHCLVISLVKVFQVTVQLLKSNLWTFTSLSYILPGIGFVAKLDKWKKTEAWIDRWFTFELNTDNKSEGLPFQFIRSVL